MQPPVKKQTPAARYEDEWALKSATGKDTVGCENDNEQRATATSPTPHLAAYYR